MPGALCRVLSHDETCVSVRVATQRHAARFACSTAMTRLMPLYPLRQRQRCRAQVHDQCPQLDQCTLQAHVLLPLCCQEPLGLCREGLAP
jgi:hypothetical protein